MPFNIPLVSRASLNNGINGTKLYAPKPIRSIPPMSLLAQKIPTLDLSSVPLLSKLQQLNQSAEEVMNSSNGETSVTADLARLERRTSEASFQSNREESAFKPCNEGHGEEESPSLSSSSKVVKSLNKEDTSENKEKEPLKRWNRTDDKHLWKIIRTVAEDQNESLEEILECIINDTQSSYWKMILPTLRDQVESFSESQTLDQVDKKGMKFFVKRVIKLNNMRAVSRREHKLIRKLLRSNKKESRVDWEQILFHFPGKRIQELMEYTLQNFPKYFQNSDAEKPVSIQKVQ